MRVGHTLASIATVLGAVFLCPTSASAAPGDPGVRECVEVDSQGYCVEWEVPTPGNPTTGGGRGTTDQVVCYWVMIPDDLATDPTIWVDFGLARPPEGVQIVWQEWECSDGSVQFNFRWVPAATPGNLAALVRGQLLGTLPQPSVGSSPPVGTASIVGIPVFVEVTNWAGVVNESACAGGLCVTVTATPALTFTPGETGSSTVACAGSGSRYDPGGGPLEDQASAAGACAHAYRLRTGASGRPAAWDGSVSVTWTIAWTASTGATGSLPSVTRSTALPRAVEEVQTVVVGGTTP